MAKKKIRPADPMAELSEIMDESDVLEQLIGDDSAAYDVDEDEINELLSDSNDLLPVVTRSIFDVPDEDEDEDDMDEYPDEDEDENCVTCGSRLLDDRLCRYCDHGDDDLTD